MASKLDTIETARLILRGINESDAEMIVQWRSDPEVYKYFKSPHQITIDEHLNWFRKRYLADNSRFDWICIEKGSGQRVGVFGLIRDKGNAEINYLLAPEGQHKGYAFEAVRRLVHYAFEEWQIEKVDAEIHIDNRPSMAVVEKLGFTLINRKEPFVVYEIETSKRKQLFEDSNETWRIR